MLSLGAGPCQKSFSETVQRPFHHFGLIAIKKLLIFGTRIVVSFLRVSNSIAAANPSANAAQGGTDFLPLQPRLEFLELGRIRHRNFLPNRADFCSSRFGIDASSMLRHRSRRIRKRTALADSRAGMILQSGRRLDPGSAGTEPNPQCCLRRNGETRTHAAPTRFK